MDQGNHSDWDLIYTFLMGLFFGACILAVLS